MKKSKILFLSALFCLLAFLPADLAAQQKVFFRKTAAILHFRIEDWAPFHKNISGFHETEKINTFLYELSMKHFNLNPKRDLESGGLFLIEGKPEESLIFYLTGNFSPSAILKAVADSEGGKLESMTINNSQIYYAKAKDWAVISGKQFLLICSEKLIPRMASGEIWFAPMPERIAQLIDKQLSFAGIFDSSLLSSSIPPSQWPAEIPSQDKFKFIGACLKDSEFYVLSDLTDSSAASQLSKFLQTFMGQFAAALRAQLQENTEEAKKAPLIQAMLSINNLYSLANLLDSLNTIKVKQDSSSVYLHFPDKDLVIKPLTISIAGILATMAIPSFKKARDSAREKVCYSNMAVIQGAVEMYNLDVNESNEMSSKYSSYQPKEPMTQLDLQRLHESRYLREIPKCPQDGTYSGTDLLGERPTIKCSIHGTKTR